MKLGTFISTQESMGRIDPELPLANIDPKDLPDRALKIMTPNLEKDNDHNNSEFPDILIPDVLNIKTLTRTNESLQVNADIASMKLDLIGASLDVVRDGSEFTPMSSKMISSQLNSIYSVFPETKKQDVDYLQTVLTSDQPTVIHQTIESLNKASDGLRSVVLRSLKVGENISKYLQGNEEIARIKENLAGSVSLLKRGERDDSANDDIVDQKKIFPEILKALLNGYEISEIPKAIASSIDESSAISETAISAISKGIIKLPLSKSRELTNTDIGRIVEYLEIVKKSQELIIPVLETTAKVVTGEVSDQVLIVGAKAIDVSVDKFFSDIKSLSKSDNDTDFNETSNKPLASFSPLPGGRVTSLMSNYEVSAPDTAGRRSYGYFSPGSLADSTDACITKLIPMISSLAPRSKLIGELCTSIAQSCQSSMSDNLRMSDSAGTNFQLSLKKLLNALKFVNSISTIGIETALNTADAVTELCRGYAILLES